MSNLLKKFTVFLFTIVLMSSVAYSQHDHGTDHGKNDKSDQPVGTKTSDGKLYGKDYDPSMPVMDYGDLLKSAQENNNKIIVVRGKVADVCQAMGCWMTMTDGTVTMRAKTSHEFLLPKDITGQDAVIIGTFKYTEISESDARHYNEESKNPLPNESIIGPQKVYELDAIGIKILNPVSDSNE